jgi:hypothetical protein
MSLLVTISGKSWFYKREKYAKGDEHSYTWEQVKDMAQDKSKRHGL